MVSSFKNQLNYNSLHQFALKIQTVHSTFPPEEFLKATIDKTWDSLEFKQRFMQISRNLGEYLPSNYKMAIAILDKVILKYNTQLDWFAICFPGFVELYGQSKENWDISMAALERYTQYASAEFAVRAFIINDETRMMAQMATWAKHDNEHVRRLASEGCRPRLPWGQALPNFQKDPTPILGILEQLKADPSAYVRKSVANNLNDIAKTHPDLVVKIAQNWYGKNTNTDWIVRHGCRTLLKQGNSDVFKLLGIAEADCVKVDGFFLKTTSISVGENLTFCFEIEAIKATQARLEYGIDYVKANGHRNRKLFQISTFTFQDDRKKSYTRNHSFANRSTRKHYPGIHSVTLIVNGTERGTLDFELLEAKQTNL